MVSRRIIADAINIIELNRAQHKGSRKSTPRVVLNKTKINDNQFRIPVGKLARCYINPWHRSSSLASKRSTSLELINKY